MFCLYLSSPGLDSECAEIVADLEKRIAETEADLQRYVTEKQQLEATAAASQAAAVDTSSGGDVTALQQQQQRQGDDTADDDQGGDGAVRERIEFTQANITGLTEELNALKESLYQFKPERMKADLETQRKAEQQK